jgi:ribonuclease VapC
MGLSRSLKISREEAYLEIMLMAEDYSITIMPITQDIVPLTLKAYDLYVKGSGSGANLNLGDVFAYVCARHLQCPLLYVGEDFAQTDLAKNDFA